MNTVILKILENANPGDLYNVLFDLLIKSKTEQVPNKYLGLTVKCILRHTKVLEKIIDKIQPEAILLKMHIYLTNTTPGNDRNSDDIGNKTIKTVLNELVKVLGDDRIYECYKVVQNDQRSDSYLKRWISVILAQKQHNVQNSQPRGQRQEAENTLHAHRERMKLSQEVNEIKLIVDKFSRVEPQQFPLVTRELYDACLKTPNINVQDYLKDLDPKYNNWIMNE